MDETLKTLLDRMEPFEAVFVMEYARTGKAGPSYLKARPDVLPTSANTMGFHLLREIHIQDAVRVARRSIGDDIFMQAKEVLREWVTIALADPSELARPRKLCCRRCYGVGHAYQWTDEVEYAQACQDAMDAVKGTENMPQLPSCSGGFGFQGWHAPHPHCTGCGGEGRLDVFVQDTDKLSAAGRKLFAGVKQTKEGIEVKTRDQDAALANIARYLGMLSTDVKLKGGLTVASAQVELSDEEKAALKAALGGLLE